MRRPVSPERRPGVVVSVHSVGVRVRTAFALRPPERIDATQASCNRRRVTGDVLPARTTKTRAYDLLTAVMTLETIRALWAHARWADHIVLDALSDDEPSPSEAVREAAHIAGAVETWLSRLEGREATLPIWPDADVDGLKAAVDETHRRFDAYLDRLEEDELLGTLTYERTSGQTYSTPVADILLHVMMHGQYHRGKINMLLRQVGRDPVPLDYIAYVRGHPASSQSSLPNP